jgi:ribonuclease HI
MKNQTLQSPDRWSPPPSSFIKLNFDGASKGNPGPAGEGGVFRNSQGEILHIYTINLGHSTNNASKLNAMVKGLNITLHKGFHKLILEGDSNLVIKICNKLLNGAPPCKISQRWRLSAIIEALPTTLHSLDVLLPSHIRRKSSKVADHLANVNVERSINILSDNWDNIKDVQLGEECATLANQDYADACE